MLSENEMNENEMNENEMNENEMNENERMKRRERELYARWLQNSCFLSQPSQS